MKSPWTSFVLALAVSSPAAAQMGAPGPPGPHKPMTPVKVQLVLSRYKGETKVGSLPYTLPCNADDDRPTNLRMGIEVPISTTKDGTPTTQYKNVGTNIDCRAEALDDGRFRLALTVEHS